MNKKRRLTNNNSTNSKIIIFLVFILIAIIFLLLIESEIIENPLTKRVKIEKNFSIQDPCSIIAGKIIHPIDRDEDCQTKCIASCEVKELKFDKSTFQRNENSCNICTCTCK